MTTIHTTYNIGCYFYEGQMVQTIETARRDQDADNYLDPDDFLREADWLEEGTYLSSQEARVRVKKGLELALGVVTESFQVAGIINSSEYYRLRKRIDVLRPKNTFAGEIICIDGRLIKWMRALAGVLSSFSAPAGHLEERQNLRGKPVAGSLHLTESILEKQDSGLLVIELEGPHTSFLTNQDDHPGGCGKFAERLREGRITGVEGDHPKFYPDGGVFLDLTDPERLKGGRLLEEMSTFMVTRIFDTDTQGKIFIGDFLKQEAIKIRENGGYLTFSKEMIRDYHQQSLVFSVEEFLTEKEAELKLLGGDLEYGSVEWASIDGLLGNLAKIVDLTEKVMASDLGEEIEKRLVFLYQDKKGFEPEIARELAVHTAYNLAVMWLSGFNRIDKVPERFKAHRERYAVLGDTTLSDFWHDTSPFLVASSESDEAIKKHLDTALKLLGGILEAKQGIDLEKEAMVLFVAAPIDPESSEKAKSRARVNLKRKYDQVIEHLESENDVHRLGENLISEGRVLVIPVLVHETSRAVVEVPDFSDLL